jgi:hypothetical protein
MRYEDRTIVDAIGEALNRLVRPLLAIMFGGAMSLSDRLPAASYWALGRSWWDSSSKPGKRKKRKSD